MRKTPLTRFQLQDIAVNAARQAGILPPCNQKKSYRIMRELIKNGLFRGLLSKN